MSKEIHTFSTVPPTDIEETAVSFVNFAREKGMELFGLYIVGLYHSDDGEVQASSQHVGCGLNELALVSCEVQQDIVRQTLEDAELSPGLVAMIGEAVREAMDGEEDANDGD